MSKIGQIRLAKEFANLQALQQDPRVDGIVNIEYNPAESGNRDEWVSIMVRPKNGLYPHRFKIEYHMPMYVGPGRLERRWHAAFVLDAPEHVLMDPRSNNNVELYEGFPCGVPYNNHVGAGWVCSGSAWAVSRNMGLWYFVICLGCLLNQEEFIMAGEPHLNAEAFHWWVEQRHKRPNNDIRWPFDLLEKTEKKNAIQFGDTKAETPNPPKFNFGTTSKPTFSFGAANK